MELDHFISANTGKRRAFVVQNHEQADEHHGA
jgi:hypothetical protein